MRKISTLAALAAAAMFAGYQQAHAGLLGMPIGLQSAIQHIKFETPTLAPMAYTQFCLRYQAECRSRITFRGGPVRLTEAGDLVLDNMTSRTGYGPAHPIGGFASSSRPIPGFGRRSQSAARENSCFTGRWCGPWSARDLGP
jgi:predicted transglutaminase-like cysteine proteinase